jgi:hypothetical protein
MTQTIGKCCFCNEDCNSFSQSCGNCARSLTGAAMGWDINPNSIVIIYYTGIGSDPFFSYTSEKAFREIINLNKNKFHEELPYNPLLCDLELLIEWSGAEMKEIN